MKENSALKFLYSDRKKERPKMFVKIKSPIFLVLLLSFLFMTVGLTGCERKDNPSPPGVVKDIETEKLESAEIQTYESLANFSVYSPSCTDILLSGDSKDKIDLTFLSEGYHDLSKFKEDVANYVDAEGVKGGMFSVEPFKSNKERFNIRLADNKKDLECRLGCFGIDRLACCNDDSVKIEA